MQSYTTEKEAISKIPEDLRSGCKEVVAKAIHEIKMMVSRAFPEINKIVKMNVIPNILQIMMETEEHDMQLNCAWIITNLASGYNIGTDEILKHNGTDCLNKLIDKSQSVHVKTQCFWALANIACENPKHRDHVMTFGVFEKLVDFIEEVDSNNHIVYLTTCIWALANFFFSRFPFLREKYCLIAMDVFIKYARSSNSKIHYEAVHGIVQIVDNTRYVDKLIESGILKDVKEELDNPCVELNILPYLVRMVGCVAVGTDEQTQYLIDNGFIPIIVKLIDSDIVNENVYKDFIWIISNIAAGRENQVKMLMENGLLGKVLQALSHNCPKIRREAVWAVKNCTRSYNRDVVIHLVRLEVLKYLTTLLDDSIEEIVSCTCDAIYNILNVGESCFSDVNLFAVLVEKYGALKKLEQLQIHPSYNIIDKCILILETFYHNHLVREMPRL